VNTTIAHAVIGKTYGSVEEFEKILLALDGTPNKSVLGANAILPCGLARVDAAAKVERKTIWQYLAEHTTDETGSVYA